ncbi:MAG: aminopeptidase N, partial [Gammaproteobacteria bacterium]|nr:aminopeptidase N [Gammaproteobacteria bacterium]
MKDSLPKSIYLKDYSPPNFFIDKTRLTFDLTEDETLVTAELHVRRNPYGVAEAALILDGHSMELLSLAIDGEVLLPHQYVVSDQNLTIPDVPHEFELNIQTKIKPQENTALEGLYKSSGM